MIEFEWDERKNGSNFAKHGIRFEEACLIFEGRVLTWTDERTDYQEVRLVSVGLIAAVMAVVVVHTDRDGKVRIISARLANRRERTLYDEHIASAPEGTRDP